MPILAVEAANLVKAYQGGGRPAVGGISLAVAPGMVFGLLGPNGSGKTATVRILVTLLRPTSRIARVCGFDVARQPGNVRRVIGYAGQATGIDDDLTAAENAAFHGMLHGLPHGEAWRRGAEALAASGLGDVAGIRAGQLSGGMRRRLDLALALVKRPEVLFLDEPTAAMGARFATGAGGGLRTRSAELTMALGFFLTLPVLFMSSAFFPLRLQPGWLQAVARLNPAYVITTGQALLNSGYQPGQQAATIIALAVAAAVLVPATVACFRSIKE